jgi:S1-C subfamily serine protease
MPEKVPEMIRCPKCSHQQTNPVECEACGLLFRKFERVRDRKKEAMAEQTADQPKGGGLMPRIASALVLVALTAGLTSYFVGGRQPETPALPALPAAVDAAAKVAPAVVHPPPEKIAGAPPVMSQGSPIEQAKNGTVAIETPWGKGSGFFISDNSIVTNKHVVAPDRSQLGEIRHQVETGRKLINLEQEKLAELRRRLPHMADGPSRKQLIIILQEREKELAKALPAQAESEARLKEMERPLSTFNIKIFLADGTEYTAQSSRISPTRDLALLSVYSAKASILNPAPKNTGLQQGDKVYTIGNPVGLRNTVTAGIFSGYRQREDTKEVFLQTDAPINPGNSGGPLIDERGLVHGVNTMILRDTQGIGFAIPIQTVLDEFSISPQSGQ